MCSVVELSRLTYIFISASTHNLAYNKHATQSSDYDSSLAPGKAVDGNSHSYFCTHEESDNNWRVDLGKDAKIYNLYIKTSTLYLEVSYSF